MTKIIYILILPAIALLTSCKKDRDCMCRSEQMPQLEALGVYHDNKKNATKKCEDQEKELRQSFPDAECELK
jgi:hypothetical protein